MSYIRISAGSRGFRQLQRGSCGFQLDKKGDFGRVLEGLMGFRGYQRVSRGLQKVSSESFRGVRDFRVVTLHGFTGVPQRFRKFQGSISYVSWCTRER